MLRGPELLSKVKELGSMPKSDVVRLCGYVSPRKDGSQRLNYTAFYEALLEAKGMSFGGAGESTSRRDSVGRKLSYIAKVHFNGNLLVGKAYTSVLGLKPGDEFDIKLERKGIRLIPKHHSEDMVPNESASTSGEELATPEKLSAPTPASSATLPGLETLSSIATPEVPVAAPAAPPAPPVAPAPIPVAAPAAPPAPPVAPAPIPVAAPAAPPAPPVAPAPIPVAVPAAPPAPPVAPAPIPVAAPAAPPAPPVAPAPIPVAAPAAPPVPGIPPTPQPAPVAAAPAPPHSPSTVGQEPAPKPPAPKPLPQTSVDSWEDSLRKLDQSSRPERWDA